MAEKRAQSEPFIENADLFPSDDKKKRSTPEGDARRRKSQQRRRRSSVFQYIAILFMAAFVLLLITFLMERRQSQQQIDDLKQSVSAYQTLQGLMEDNEALQARVDELERELEAQKETAYAFEVAVDGVTDTLSHTENVLAWTSHAMDYFWQINEAYVRGRYALCRELIAKIESPETDPAAGPLMEYLPKESATDTDRFSPYDRYMEIRGQLIR